MRWALGQLTMPIRECPICNHLMHSEIPVLRHRHISRVLLGWYPSSLR